MLLQSKSIVLQVNFKFFIHFYVFKHIHAGKKPELTNVSYFYNHKEYYSQMCVQGGILAKYTCIEREGNCLQRIIDLN